MNTGFAPGIVALVSAAAALASCGSDGSRRTDLGAVEAPEAGTGSPDAGETPLPPPGKLSVTACPPVPGLPPALDPRDAVTSVAATASRIYVASARAVYAFERDGACAGDIEPAFHGGALEVDQRPEALAASDSVGVVVADGRGAVLRTDDPFTSGCLATTPLRTVGLAGAFTVGAFVDPRVWVMGGRQSGCAAEPLAVPAVNELLAVGAASATSIVAVVRAGRAVSVRRYAVGSTLTASAETSDGPCSARTVVPTANGALVLDPSCGAVRQYDFTVGREVQSHGLARGAVGRGLARIPGESRAVLATTPAEGGAATLYDVVFPE